MKKEIQILVDAYIDKQRKSYEKTNNFERCFHRFQGYIACLIDMGMITKEQASDMLDYMYDKLEGIEN